MTYEGQLLFKQKQVKDVLERIGKLDLSNVTVHPTLGMEDPWNYRNKAQVPVGEREGGLVAGFYQQRSHDIIDMSACLIQQSKTTKPSKPSKTSVQHTVSKPITKNATKAGSVTLWSDTASSRAK